MEGHVDDASPLSGVYSSVSGSARDVVQARDIYGGVHYHAAVPSAQRSALRQLPADTASFTGREYELDQILGQIDRALEGARPGILAISAINGMAGVGKTALAVHAAHRVAQRFPDGQLFVDLHGYTSGLSPQDPADVLAAILNAFGMPPGRIPSDLEARATLYRDHLADSRTLIVLDNAVNEQQVRPLLPGAGQCLVLVTSRNRLKGLDDAHPLSLDVLSTAETVELFRQTALREFSPADDPALWEIARLCGRLPLALRIAAALLRHRPSWTLVRLIDKLRGGLAGFSDSDRDLSAVFDLSYQALADDRQELFRRLGLVPGPDIDSYATAALLHTDLARAERLLQDLVDHNLLTEPVAGRYRMHDLIRLHAQSVAQHDPPEQRSLCSGRLLDYYRHTARQATTRVSRFGGPAPIGAEPRHVPDLPDMSQAHVWLQAEHANLTACLEQAAGRADHVSVVELAAGLTGIDGPWPQALALNTAAIEAACHLGDASRQADALNQLGLIQGFVGDVQGASQGHEKALQIYRDLGDRLSQANTLIQLGNALCTSDRYQDALRNLQRALEMHQDLGDRRGQATALTGLGRVYMTTGDLPDAIRVLEAALDLYGGLGRYIGEDYALMLLGMARQDTGDYQQAMRCFQQSLEFYEQTGDPLGRAQVLASKGTLLLRTGDYAQAQQCLESASDIQFDLGGPGRGYILIEMGNLRKAAGDPAGAARCYRQALEIFKETDALVGEAWTLNNHAALLRDTGDVPQAREANTRALALADRFGIAHLRAHALEGLGLCSLRDGTLAGATARLDAAADAFRRLGMKPDVDRVRAQIASLSEP